MSTIVISRRQEASPSSATTAHDMTMTLPAAGTTAEVLKELRRAFPDMPLAERVAALAALTRA